MRAKLRKALGGLPAEPFGDGARDRRRDRLLLAQPAAARLDREGDRDRHLAGDARFPGGQCRRARGRRLDRGERRRAAAFRRPELRPRLRPRGPPPHPRPGRAPSPSSTGCCARAGRSPSAASPRAMATVWRRCRSGRAGCWRPPGARLWGRAPLPPTTAVRGPRSRARGRGGRPRLHPRRPRRRFEAGRLRRSPGPWRGAARQHLGLGPSLGRGERRTRHRSGRWRRFAFRSYLALQRVDESVLEPRLPPQLFYNLVLSARKAPGAFGMGVSRR